MSVFLLKTLLGSSYVPPAPTGIFDDVPADGFQPFIEDLYNRGITGGCAGGPPPAPDLLLPDKPGDARADGGLPDEDLRAPAVRALVPDPSRRHRTEAPGNRGLSLFGAGELPVLGAQLPGERAHHVAPRTARACGRPPSAAAPRPPPRSLRPSRGWSGAPGTRRPSRAQSRRRPSRPAGRRRARSPPRARPAPVSKRVRPRKSRWTVRGGTPREARKISVRLPWPIRETHFSWPEKAASRKSRSPVEPGLAVRDRFGGGNHSLDVAVIGDAVEADREGANVLLDLSARLRLHEGILAS